MVRKPKSKGPDVVLAGADEFKASYAPETHAAAEAAKDFAKSLGAPEEDMTEAADEILRALGPRDSEEVHDISDLVPPQVADAARTLRPEEVYNTRPQSKFLNSPEAASGEPTFKEYISDRLEQEPDYAIKLEMKSLKDAYGPQPVPLVGDAPTHETPNMTQMLISMVQKLQDEIQSLKSSRAEPEISPSLATAVHDVVSRGGRKPAELRSEIKTKAADLAYAERQREIGEARKRETASLVSEFLSEAKPKTSEEYQLEQAILDAQKTRKFKNESIIDLEQKLSKVSEEIGKIRAQLETYELGHPVRKSLEDAVTLLLVSRNEIEAKIAAVRKDKTRMIAMMYQEAESRRALEETRAQQKDLEDRESRFEESFREWLAENIASKLSVTLDRATRKVHLEEQVSRVVSDPHAVAEFKAKYRDYLNREARRLKDLARKPKVTSSREVRKSEGPMQLANTAQSFRVFASGPPRDHAEDFWGH